METRASHLVIGAFVLATVAALFGFVVWLAKVNVDREFVVYKVFFTESVSGLGLGGDVRYRGIKVGRIADIGIDADDPGRVEVTLELGTTVREGDKATVKPQGITGVSYIDISGAVKGSRALPSAVAGEPAVVPVEKAALEHLEQFVVQGLPEAAARFNTVAGRLAELLDQDNQRLVRTTLANIVELTAGLIARQDQLGRVFDSMEGLSRELSATVRSVRQVSAKLETLADEANGALGEARGLLGSANTLLLQDVKRMIADLRGAARGLKAVTDEASGLLKDNREPLERFASEGLREFSRFVNDARILVASMSRLTERLESEGARFLLGPGDTGFEARQ